MICDFCSEPATWGYECAGFTMAVMGGVKHYSPDDWAACDECKNLIDNNERRALVARAVEFFYRNNPDLPKLDEITTMVSSTHRGFFDKKRGQAYPLVV